MKNNPTILITGGHLTPALAVMDEIAVMHKSWRIVFVGREYTLEGTRVPSEEKRVVSRRGVEFIALSTGRLMREVSLRALLSLLKVPLAIAASFGILAATRPVLVLSFGGYVALPVVVAAWARGISVLTHEQTQGAGLANKVIARLSRKICVSFEETLSLFPPKKAVVTGLPLRRSLFTKPKGTALPLPQNPGTLLYITGGTTGAASLNAIVYKALGKLLAQGTVIHQVGRYSLDEAVAVRTALPSPVRRRYIVAPYLDDSEYVWVLHHADLVIGRGGANTVAELAALGNVAILVPLPWSAGGEQEKNAQWLAANGGAIVASQKELNAEKLLSLVSEVMRNYKRYKIKATSFATSVPRDGAARIVGEIEDIVASPHPSSL